MISSILKRKKNIDAVINFLLKKEKQKAEQKSRKRIGFKSKDQ